MPIDNICIVGPTASGKTALGIALCEHLGTEIISADAMQVYRRMDIGTAKPSVEERGRVPHHLVDVSEPAEPFTVVDFQRLAFAARDGLHARGLVSVLVGGTGLYVSAYVDELEFPGRFEEVAESLEAEPDTAELYARLVGLDELAASRMEPNNRRRVLRALEVTLGSGRKFSSFGPGLRKYEIKPCMLQVGLEISRDLLDVRIEQRFHAQLEAGFLNEVSSLAEDLQATSAQALGYKELLCHLKGEISLNEAIEEALRRIRRFARRQQRWFRRDPRVVWIDAEASTDEQFEKVKDLIEISSSTLKHGHGSLDGMRPERGSGCVS